MGRGDLRDLHMRFILGVALGVKLTPFVLGGRRNFWFFVFGVIDLDQLLGSVLR